ncbi:MAG: hypothetical protein ACHRHE_01390 [Tepidisphaerales bacterium]
MTAFPTRKPDGFPQHLGGRIANYFEDRRFLPDAQGHSSAFALPGSDRTGTSETTLARFAAHFQTNGEAPTPEEAQASGLVASRTSIAPSKHHASKVSSPAHLPTPYKNRKSPLDIT